MMIQGYAGSITIKVLDEKKLSCLGEAVKMIDSYYTYISGATIVAAMITGYAMFRVYIDKAAQ